EAGAVAGAAHRALLLDVRDRAFDVAVERLQHRARVPERDELRRRRAGLDAAGLDARQLEGTARLLALLVLRAAVVGLVREANGAIVVLVDLDDVEVERDRELGV